VVVVSAIGFNAWPVGLVVVPVTTRDRGFVHHVPVAASGLDRVSYAMPEYIRSISQRRLRRHLGAAQHATLDELDDWLRRITALRHISRGTRWVPAADNLAACPDRNGAVAERTRYGIEVARLSVAAAGEDIRYLLRAIAERLGLEPYDAWLFDDQQLVRLHFSDSDDTFAGAELVADDEAVRRHRQWRDIAWRSAQPLEDFVTALP
jgi:mRNA-degrading endonuclease toxin of MazEF toxin-antitoxin module